jgi:Glycosyl hydrolase family 81 C-terminal domain/Glycosyl hydrolase family 81 N-terminal domain
VSATSPFSGLLRLALMPSGSASPQSSSSSSSTTSSSSTSSSSSEPYNASASQIAASTGLQRLIYHAGVYPVRGDFSWAVRSSDAESAATALKSAAKSISGVMSLAAGNMVGTSRDPTLGMPGGGTGASTGSSSSSKSGPQSATSNSDRIATITFQFATGTFSPSSSGATTQKSLLMLALPHHAMSLPPSIQLGPDQFDLQYLSIKGPMHPVLGSTWSYDEPLPPVGFEIADGKERQQARQRALRDPIVRSTIVESLQGDIELALPTLDENVYGFGKQTARLAQLAHIVHELRICMEGTNSTLLSSNTGEEDHPPSDLDDLNDLTDRVIGYLRPALEHFLTNSVSDYLVYDANLGGIVTINGLRSKDADFGNGRYNDHHFHYGYLLYACAIMGKIDPTFVQSYGTAVDSMYFDVASDSNFVSQKTKGVFFPAARHKSWFDGHSFASGLFPFGNGKSQESSSEAVNCYYGALLWSLVRHGAAHDSTLDVSYQTDFARILLATEIRGAQLYWHMHPPAQGNNSEAMKIPVYSPSFAKNYMVGNLGMLDAVASTWFGTESLYVHMINEIPVTAVTEQLFSKSFVQQEYENVLKPLGEVQMAWQGYVVCNLAIVDARAAWDEAQKLFSPELDSALSKSQVLYWIATRPDFVVPTNSSNASSGNSKSLPSSKQATTSDSSTSEEYTSCANHKACARAGLLGACCPTSDGVLLECCNS